MSFGLLLYGPGSVTDRPAVTQGADSNILPIVETASDYQSQEILYRTQQQLNVSSRRGLRVLVLAKKVRPGFGRPSHPM